MQRIDDLMTQYPNLDIFDCRLNPWSWRIRYQKQELEKRWGKRYHYAGGYLGNAKHPSNQLLPGKLEIELVNHKVGIATLRSYLLRGHDAILLCACFEYQYCHLKEVVRLLQEALPEVEVILPPGPPVENPYKFPAGSKVFAKLKGKKTPAVVLESRWSQEGNYDQTRLRVAQYNELRKEWLVSDYPKPVQSYKLTKRGTTVPGLDQ